MLDVLTRFSAVQDWKLVFMAGLVCLAAQLTAFIFYGRARRQVGHKRLRWFIFTGLVAASGVWAAHFIIVSSTAPASESNTPTTLGVAVLGAAIGFLIATAKPKAWIGLSVLGAVAVAGASLASFLGLSVFGLEAELLWNASYAWASIMLGLAGVVLALFVGGRADTWQRRLSGAVVLAVTICLVNLTSLVGDYFLPGDGGGAQTLLSSAALSTIVAGLIGLVISGGVSGYLVEARSRETALQRLREALDVMPEGLAFYDADDRLIIWNARYTDLAEGGDVLQAGVTFRDLLQAGLARGVYPEARGREDEWLEARLALHRTGHSTHEQQLDDGRWLRVEDRRTGDGGVITVCEDISEMKRREASLRLMFESNPAPMWVIDAETRKFMAVNEAAVAQYGYTREQFLTLHLSDLYAEEEHEELEITASMIDLLGAYRGERTWRQLRADGSDVFARPYVQYFRYEDRPAFMSAQFDVTVSKRAEEAMALARDQAEAANRAKSEFLANMSHEIRTPLNGVTGLAQVLGRTELNAQQQELVRIIESSATTLERILADVLDIARVESGHIDIRDEEFDLAETVRTAAGLSELRAQEKGVAFRLVIDPAAEGLVSGDSGRLKQILFNLLSNALKFTAAGSIEVRVGVRETSGGPVFRFEVEDTGVGFEPSCKDRLFQRFEQADGSITRRYGGTGLGLAISRDLAELMGGHLDARSEPGSGSTFSLDLPLQRSQAAPAAAQVAARPEPEPAGGGLRVLLAEDHPVNRKVIEMMLDGTGVRLTCVDNGEEAVGAVAAERFDVVLMDMQMPVMDGLTAVRAIRDHERAAGVEPVRIFILSANAMADHAKASLTAGADRHITKPIAAPVLLGALAEVVLEKTQAAA